MKIITFIILVLLAIVLNVCAQEFPAVNPEAPIPVAIEKKIENVKNIILAVITALTVVGTAAVGLWVYIMGQIRQAKATQDLQVRELKDRQDRLSRKNSELQAQVTQTALATPVVTPANKSPATGSGSIGLIALLLGSMALMGCGGSIEGLTKDQIAERQRQRAAWSDFGIGVLTLGVNAGVAAFSNSGERRLPNDPGLRKN